MDESTLHTATGRPLDTLTMEAVLRGAFGAEDLRISAETLLRQAEAAEVHGYRPLAENFRRAAELTRISNEEVLAIYDALRPGRTSYDRLIALAERLETELEAPRTAALVREAAEVYRARGLVEREEA